MARTNWTIPDELARRFRIYCIEAGRNPGEALAEALEEFLYWGFEKLEKAQEDSAPKKSK